MTGEKRRDRQKSKDRSRDPSRHEFVSPVDGEHASEGEFEAATRPRGRTIADPEEVLARRPRVSTRAHRTTQDSFNPVRVAARTVPPPLSLWTRAWVTAAFIIVVAGGAIGIVTSLSTRTLVQSGRAAEADRSSAAVPAPKWSGARRRGDGAVDQRDAPCGCSGARRAATDFAEPVAKSHRRAAARRDRGAARIRIERGIGARDGERRGFSHAGILGGLAPLGVERRTRKFAANEADRSHERRADRTRTARFGASADACARGLRRPRKERGIRSLGDGGEALLARSTNLCPRRCAAGGERETLIMPRSSMLLAVSLLFSVPKTSAAQSEPGPMPRIGEAERDQARHLYDEAIQYGKRGEYRKAKASLSAAWALLKSWEIAVNLGSAEIRLGQYRDAAEHLAWGIRDGAVKEGENYGPLLKAKTLLAEAAGHVGQLKLLADEPGASIFVDDDIVGKSPLVDPLYLEPGTHVIMARPANLERSSLTLEVKIQPGDALERYLLSEWRAVLSPNRARARSRRRRPLRCRPTGASSNRAPRCRWLWAGSRRSPGGVALAFTIKGSAANSAATDWAMRTGGNCDVPSAACNGLADARERRNEANRIANVAWVGAGMFGVATLATVLFWPKGSSAMARAQLRVAPRGGDDMRGVLVSGALNENSLRSDDVQIILGAGATFAVMSAAGCGATESTCKELQRTCGCDDRKPCPGDGAAGNAGAGGANGAAGIDASDETGRDADGVDAEAGSGGKGGTAGTAGSGGTAGTSGAAGKGGAVGDSGTGGTREDAAIDAPGVDRQIDVVAETTMLLST